MMIMKFELLSNELFLQIFQYLNVSDLFYSFDQLNTHFSRFIRNIPLYFDFNQMKKSTFNYFCQMILSNPELKQRIVHLQLSNDGTLGQIESFLSIFPLKDFINLHSLSLINLTTNNIKQLLPTLQFLSNLRSFSFSGENCKSSEIISALSKTKLQKLSIPYMEFPSLTISDLFEFIPRLKSLKIECLLDNKEMIQRNSSTIIKKNHIYLKELIIDHCKIKFENLEILLKSFPNLKILSIFIDHDKNIFDAIRWQTLIESSLKHLSIFKFDFRNDQSRNFTDKLNQFQQFQTDFWQKQHHWFTNLEISSHFITIYTIPYERNHYELTRDINLYGQQSINNTNVFDKVKTLSLSTQRITNDSKYYFKNVQILKIENDYDEEEEDDDDDKREVKDLYRIVNVSNIKHLVIDQEAGITPLLFLDLLKQLPNVSSLTIDEYTLMTMKIYNNVDLCKYLNRNIKTLDISVDECLDEKIFPKKIHLIFSKVFSNLEQFVCDYIKDVDDLLVILKQCPKLSIVKCQAVSKSVHKWILGNASRLNIYFDFKSVNEEEDDDDDDDEFSDEE